MQDNARKLTYGAMMIAIFIILLAISVYVPLLGTVTMLFIPLPIMLYRLRYDRVGSIFVLITGMVLSLFGGILLLPVAFVFGPLGFVIGEALQRKKTKFYTFMAAGLTFLITTIILYLASIVLFGINTIDELSKMIMETQGQIVTLLESTGEISEDFIVQLNDTIHYTLLAIPSAFILSSFLFAFVIILINLPIIERLGHEVPKFLAFRFMKLPVYTVWAYMIVILLPLFTNMEPGSTTELTYINASFILRFLFLLQGISFIHHIMYEMKVNKWVTILLSLVAVIISPLTIIVGILDTGIQLRAWIGRDKSR